ncbi:hypothetical protein LAA29_80040 [Leuconostoc carnosum]|uniref:hypothetical protein n=1 Tax=Leuconostoc carnosum TaxID=1252 RepID=UPI000D515007|nr:hypothetical protein [Leuconostoc carnosum]SPO34424.1 hypothetical protein LAA29_80040 [Leuconostoc carnosum]
MTEPVAYLNKYLDSSTNITRYKPENQRLLSSDPLYTAEKLHPRVKMTQAEFETIKIIKQKNNLLSDALNSTAFFGDEKQQSEQQIEFANIFINLDLDKPEETIEIVPDMKWFVRSKEPEGEDEDDYYLFMSGSNLDDLDYLVFDYAMAFDTKEEAELWKNPLTEAVQLPVEGE